MSDIPEDIMRAAASVFLTEVSLKGDQIGGTFIQERIARAILAERERCAQIADGWAAEPDPDEVDPYDEYEMGGRSYSRSIAAAIRSPERAGE